MTEQATNLLFEATSTCNLDKAKEALNQGADINAVNHIGETPLVDAISCCDDRIFPDVSGSQWKSLITYLLEQGANPDYREDDGCGVLFEATLTRNAELIEMLLKAGADPNIIMNDCETIYDDAEFTYRFNTYDRTLELPMKHGNSDEETEEAWLDFLDRCAENASKPKSDYLRVLRKYGALTLRELKEKPS